MIEAVLDSMRVIDLKAARADPDAVRAALARKGAAEAFDRLLEADERWRALVPRVDELRGRTKLKGKPTPGAARGAAAGQGGAQGGGGRSSPPPRPSATRWRCACRTRRTTSSPTAPPRTTSASCAASASRRARRRARAHRGRAASTWSGRRGSPARASATGSATRRCSRSRSTGSRSTGSRPRGSSPVLPPVLVREEALVGTGCVPLRRGRTSTSSPADDLYLAGTAEIPRRRASTWTEILAADELPLRYVGFSPCFRREAGAAGKDTRGMFRVHQFNKVEQFVVHAAGGARGTSTSGSSRTRRSSSQALELPYRVVVLPAGDMSTRLGEDVRRRDLVPEPGPLPRDGVDLEHDRLPGPPPRDPLPRRARARARAHAERHRGRRPHGARDPRELPGRRPRRAARVRRARHGSRS